MVNHRIKFDPQAKYTVKDFLRKGIIITCVLRFKNQNRPHCRIFFRGENLFAEIRTCCYGTLAIDTSKASSNYNTKDEQCITTECKSMREAKSMVWSWFESQGWHQKASYNAHFTPMKELSHYKPIINYYL